LLELRWKDAGLHGQLVQVARPGTGLNEDTSGTRLLAMTGAVAPAYEYCLPVPCF